MIEHKYDIGDTVKWYMKRINDEGTLEIDKEYGPATGVIKEIITDQHLIKSFFETEIVGTAEEPLYGVYVDWNSPCLKHDTYKCTSIDEDEDSPIPSGLMRLCLMKESEIFM